MAKLQKVAGHCAKADRDFWPAELNAHLGLAAATPAGAVAAPASAPAEVQVPEAAASMWHLLGLPAEAVEAAGGGAAAKSSSADADAAEVGLPSDAGSAPTCWQALSPSGGQSYTGRSIGSGSEGQQAEADSDGVAAPAAAAQDQQPWLWQQQPWLGGEQSQPSQQGGASSSARVVHVTLRDAVGHLMQSAASATPTRTTQGGGGVVHVTLSDVCAHLASTRLAHGAARAQRRLSRRVAAWADGLAQEARRAVPWPQLEVSRRSALRCRVQWHGLSQPPWRAQPALELVLSEHY